MDGSPDSPEYLRTDESGPVRGLLQSLASLLANFVAIGQTRLELFTTELQQEMHRIAEILVWTLIAILAAGIGLFLAALVVVFIFWDSHRILASVLVTAAFFTLAIVSMLVLRSKLTRKPRMLEATLTELAKDRDQLMSRRR